MENNKERIVAIIIAIGFALFGILFAFSLAHAGGATATVPVATASVLGLVKPDGTTITNSSGAISVTYGTAANTAAQGNDSRITGAAPASSPTFTGTVTLPSGISGCLSADGTTHAVTGTTSACGTGGSGANASGYYVVTQSANEPANAINLGALTTGLGFHTISGGIATPSTYAGTSCTNQAITALNASGAASCTTITSAYVSNSIAATGADINTSNQVTITHLASPLPVAQGGTAVTTASANYIFSGPTSGSAAAPAFRALVSADLPLTPVTSANGGTITASYGYYIATGATTFTLPATASGERFCFRQTDAGTNAILVTPPTSSYVENTSGASYCTVSHAIKSGGANGDMLCVAAIDTTHWLTTGSVGTWTCQ